MFSNFPESTPRRWLRKILEPIRKNGVFDVPGALERGRVISRNVRGQTVRWLITNINDEIQSSQAKFGFYELKELELIRKHVGEGRTILDIGSNIGNHAVYFSKFMNPKRLVLFEPYAPAIRHLLVNLSLNYEACFDLSHLGTALGEAAQMGTFVPPTKFNIGLTRLDLGSPGKVPVQTGDDVVGEASVDFIKIDVEGMEVDVLRGLTKTIERCCPTLFVEVSDSNRQSFMDIVEARDYQVVEEIRLNHLQSNFLVARS